MTPDLSGIAAELADALRIAGACPRCGGKGKLRFHHRGPHPGPSIEDDCDRCDGSGLLVGPRAAIEKYERAMAEHPKELSHG